MTTIVTFDLKRATSSVDLAEVALALQRGATLVSNLSLEVDSPWVRGYSIMLGRRKYEQSGSYPKGIPQAQIDRVTAANPSGYIAASFGCSEPVGELIAAPSILTFQFLFTIPTKTIGQSANFIWGSRLEKGLNVVVQSNWDSILDLWVSCGEVIDATEGSVSMSHDPLLPHGFAQILDREQFTEIADHVESGDVRTLGNSTDGKRTYAALYPPCLSEELPNWWPNRSAAP